MSKVVGIDIGGTKMMMFSNVGGNVVEKTVPTGDETTPAIMTRQIHEFIQSLNFIPDAVGVCVPGLVKDGVLFYASDRRNLEGLSEDMISTPQYRAYMINDIRAAMYSQIPNYPKGSSICVIVIGTGIGMSVVLNGHFLCGANGYVGEWGFCPLRLEDGRVTTYDQVITGKAIVENTGLDPKDINAKLEEGDERVTSIIKSAGYYCGWCLAYCINLFNPDYIILTGSTTNYKNYRSIAIETCNQCTLNISRKSCRIVDPPEGGRIVILGTIEYARMMFEGAEVV